MLRVPLAMVRLVIFSHGIKEASGSRIARRNNDHPIQIHQLLVLLLADDASCCLARHWLSYHDLLLVVKARKPDLVNRLTGNL